MKLLLSVLALLYTISASADDDQCALAQEGAVKQAELLLEITRKEIDRSQLASIRQHLENLAPTLKQCVAETGNQNSTAIYSAVTFITIDLEQAIVVTSEDDYQIDHIVFSLLRDQALKLVEDHR